MTDVPVRPPLQEVPHATPLTSGKKTGIGVALTAAIGLIVASVIDVEGGYVNNPKDPGGATNHGITEAVARKHGYEGDMKYLTQEKAVQIYGADYVIKPNFHLIIEQSQAVGHKVVDIGVNMGPHRPSCWFQESLNSLNSGGRYYKDLTVDCKVGPATVAAYKALADWRGKVGACQAVLKLMEGQQAAEYLRLTKVNRDLRSFQYGWISNRIGNVKLADCAKGGT